jgi:hypothetical protein
VLSLDYAHQSDVSKKCWLIVTLDAEKESKIFVQIKDETEYHNIILDVVNQIKNL